MLMRGWVSDPKISWYVGWIFENQLQVALFF